MKLTSCFFVCELCAWSCERYLCKMSMLFIPDAKSSWISFHLFLCASFVSTLLLRSKREEIRLFFHNTLVCRFLCMYKYCIWNARQLRAYQHNKTLCLSMLCEYLCACVFLLWFFHSRNLRRALCVFVFEIDFHHFHSRVSAKRDWSMALSKLIDSFQCNLMRAQKYVYQLAHVTGIAFHVCDDDKAQYASASASVTENDRRDKNVGGLVPSALSVAHAKVYIVKILCRQIAVYRTQWPRLRPAAIIIAYIPYIL